MSQRQIAHTFRVPCVLLGLKVGWLHRRIDRWRFRP